MMQSSVSVCYSCFVKKFLDNIHICLNCCLLIGCYKCLKSLACREVLKFIFLLFSTAKSKSWMVSLTSVSVSLLSIQPYLVCHTQVLFFSILYVIPFSIFYRSLVTPSASMPLSCCPFQVSPHTMLTPSSGHSQDRGKCF